MLSQRIQSRILVLVLGDLNVHIIDLSDVHCPVITAMATIVAQGHIITGTAVFLTFKCLPFYFIYSLTPLNLLNVLLGLGLWLFWVIGYFHLYFPPVSRLDHMVNQFGRIFLSPLSIHITFPVKLIWNKSVVYLTPLFLHPSVSQIP